MLNTTDMALLCEAQAFTGAASISTSAGTTRSGVVYIPASSPPTSPTGRPHLTRTGTINATLFDAAGVIGAGVRTRRSAPFEDHGGHMLRIRQSPSH